MNCYGPHRAENDVLKAGTRVVLSRNTSPTLATIRGRVAMGHSVAPAWYLAGAAFNELQW